MRRRMLPYIALTLSFAISTSTWLVGQNPIRPPKKIRYRVITLPTEGGTFGAGSGINNLGWISGNNETAGNMTQEATLWLYGLTLPLGSLGGPNSGVPFPAKDDAGILEGVADLSTPDPLGENFCAFNDGFQCSAFWWQNGVITGLPDTLGGNNSRAASADNFGHVVGWEETGMQDSTCILPAVLQYVPVVWNIKDPKHPKRLPTLNGDPDGAAVAINEHNQVVGISGPCGDDDGLGARHAVIWQNGTVTDLGNFGGQFFNTAAAINNSGVVAGWLDAPNDTNICTPNCYGFVWTQPQGLTKILPVSGDVNSLGFGINDRGQVVGQSIDANGNSRAFIWQNGKTVDLNTLTLPGSPYLLFAGDINNHGDITGQTFDQSTGQFGPGFVAIPVESGDEPAGYAQGVSLPENVRQEIRQHLGQRGWVPGASN